MSDHFFDDFIKNLPIYPDILGNKKNYSRSVVLVPFILIDGEYHIVFEKRAKNIRQGGEICFPGGMIDPKDVSREATAQRETSEELGIPKEKIKILGKMDTLVAKMGTIVYIFVGELNASFDEFKIDEKEVEKVFTIKLSYFLETSPEEYQIKLIMSPFDDSESSRRTFLPVEELGIPEKYHKPWSHMHKVYAYKTDFGTIWGITAEILNELKIYF